MNSNKIFTDQKFIILFALICTFLWGSAYPSIKIGYEIFNISSIDVFSKIVFAGYRFILAGIMVLVAALILNKNLKINIRRDWYKVLVLGLFQTALQYIFFYIGLANTSGLNGSLMNATGTFFSVILAHFIYKNDKVTFRKALGCVLGFIGVMCVNLSSDLATLQFNFLGDGFIVISALILSAASIYGKKLCETINSVLLTGYQLLLGGFLLTFLGHFNGGKLTNFTFSSSLLLLYMGFLSAAAFTLWALLLKYNKVSKISIYHFLIPIFGTLLSAVFLKEQIMELKNLIALLLVCFGIYIVNK